VSTKIGYLSAMMTTSQSIDRGDRFPAEVIEQAVWLYFRFPLSLRMVEDSLRLDSTALP
jgi:transposase-like protein